MNEDRLQKESKSSTSHSLQNGLGTGSESGSSGRSGCWKFGKAPKGVTVVLPSALSATVQVWDSDIVVVTAPGVVSGLTPDSLRMGASLCGGFVCMNLVDGSRVF